MSQQDSNRPTDSDEVAKVLANMESGDGGTATTPSTVDLGIVETEADKKAKIDQENREQFSGIGFRSISTDNLPSRGRFNKPGMMVKVRAATTEEIKHYSALDENDLLDVDDHINKIISSTTRITYEDGTVGTPGDLKEADKYYLFFTIRDITMTNRQRQHNLTQSATCPKCHIKLTQQIDNTVFSNYQIAPEIERHYDAEQRCFVLRHESFDNPVKVYVPSIGVIKYIKSYLSRKAQEKRAGKDVYYDQKFITKAQFMVGDHRKLNDELLDRLHKSYNNMNPDESVAFHYATDNINVGVNPYLEFKCEGKNEGGCSEPYVFTAPVTFSKGFKSIFDFTDIIGGLFGNPEQAVGS